jgi:hypothetical protein
VQNGKRNEVDVEKLVKADICDLNIFLKPDPIVCLLIARKIILRLQWELQF